MMPGRCLVIAAIFAGLVFAAGFALGTIREILIRPVLGPDWSRIAELPVMIAITWFAARRVVVRFGVDEPWLAIGMAAFVFLMLAEMLLGWAAFRLSPLRFLASFATPAGFLSGLAQASLIVFPMLAARRKEAS